MDVTTFTLWDYLLLAMCFIALMAVLWAIDARGWIGSKVAKLLPFATIQQGDKVHIYLNGEYNRTATLSKVAVDCVYIYDSAIRLPLSHRGRFYGIGVDAADGSHVVLSQGTAIIALSGWLNLSARCSAYRMKMVISTLIMPNMSSLSAM